MMAYGREVQQLLLPGNGAAHVRLLIDLLSQTRSEAAEADHLNAVARLKSAVGISNQVTALLSNLLMGVSPSAMCGTNYTCRVENLS